MENKLPNSKGWTTLTFLTMRSIRLSTLSSSSSSSKEKVLMHFSINEGKKKQIFRKCGWFRLEWHEPRNNLKYKRVYGTLIGRRRSQGLHKIYCLGSKGVQEEIKRRIHIYSGDDYILDDGHNNLKGFTKNMFLN